MLSIICVAIWFVISLTLIIGGALNLFGCGDRIGEEYGGTNWLQIVLGGIMLVIIILSA